MIVKGAKNFIARELILLHSQRDVWTDPLFKGPEDGALLDCDTP